MVNIHQNNLETVPASVLFKQPVVVLFQVRITAESLNIPDYLPASSSQQVNAH